MENSMEQQMIMRLFIILILINLMVYFMFCLSNGLQRISGGWSEFDTYISGSSCTIQPT